MIGVVLAFGLGLAVLFIHLYPGRTGTSFALLTGQIVGVGYSGLVQLVVVAVHRHAVLAVAYRPLLFATVDPEVAIARGVPVRGLGHRVRGSGRSRRGARRADRRRTTRDVVADHACSGGGAGVLVAGCGRSRRPSFSPKSRRWAASCCRWRPACRFRYSSP